MRWTIDESLPTRVRDRPMDAAGRCGRVALVGAGPGDPELLTLRAARLIGAAQAVVYDHLVDPRVLEMVPVTARRVYVGKQSKRHSLPQSGINALLVTLAREGLAVVRLKGGDPFMFGRGGEEAEHLVENGVPFEVVPGVTSAAGAASYAGIPLTHRDHAQSCVFVTGHLRDDSCALDWPALARPRQTLVVYMGLGQIEEIARQLIAHGMPGDTPAAAVERATTPAQRVVCASVATIAAEVSRLGVLPPALIVIGTVVALREALVTGMGAAHAEFSLLRPVPQGAELQPG